MFGQLSVNSPRWALFFTSWEAEGTFSAQIIATHIIATCVSRGVLILMSANVHKAWLLGFWHILPCISLLTERGSPLEGRSFISGNEAEGLKPANHWTAVCFACPEYRLDPYVGTMELWTIQCLTGIWLPWIPLLGSVFMWGLSQHIYGRPGSGPLEAGHVGSCRLLGEDAR